MKSLYKLFWFSDTFHNPSRVGSYLTTSIDAFKGLPKTEDNPLSHTADLQKKRITSIAFGILYKLCIIIIIYNYNYYNYITVYC